MFEEDDIDNTAEEVATLHIRLKAAVPEELRAAHNVELSIPQTSGRLALNKLLLHLLSLEKGQAPEFHFLARDEPLRTTFDKFLERRSLSAEETLEVTYYIPLPEPNQDEPIQSSTEWLSSVSAVTMASTDTVAVVAGSYSGVANVHRFSLRDGTTDSTIFSTVQEYSHAAPIKDVCWLANNDKGNDENENGAHFISVSEDETARVWRVAEAQSRDNEEDNNEKENEGKLRTMVVPCGLFGTRACGQPTSLSAVAVDTNDTKKKALIGADDGSIWLLPDLSEACRAKSSMDVANDTTAPTSTSAAKRKRVALDTIPATRLGVGTSGLPSTCVGWRDGVDALSAGWDSMVRVWDVQSCIEKVAIPAGGKSVIAMSVGESSIAVGAMDGAVRLVDGRNGQGVTAACNRKGAHKGVVTAVSWLDRDRNFVSTGFDGSLRFWDVRAMVAPVRIITRLHGRSQCFAVDHVRSEDNQSWRIFTAGADGKVARLTL